MKQIQFPYTGKDALVHDLRRINQWCQQNISSCVLFEIYSEMLDKTSIDIVCSTIKSEMPQALYCGATTNGNIMLAQISKENICIVCTIFEYPTTQISIMQREINENNSVDVADEVIRFADENKWVKAVEMVVTIRNISTSVLCSELGRIRDDVEVFGGGAFANDIDEQQAYVFSSDGECRSGSVVFRFLGGEQLHIKTMQITGWKTLGSEHTVTRSKGKQLCELDGEPAYKVYYKYLNIENDRNFFRNSIEFPIVYKVGGNTILRAPIGSLPDGSLMMTANIEEGAKVRIAYGDPGTILRTVKAGGDEISMFQPQSIHIYSCAARRFFWGDMADTETLPFQGIAQTSGFYTSGEFLRKDGTLVQHNVTLVIASFREGDIVYGHGADFEMQGIEFSKQISLISRLANFINVSTQELEEANKKLEQMAVTDGLTQLFNRMKIQSDIIQSISDKSQQTALIMIDIDDFKKVNDTHGHDEGDLVLRGLSDMLVETMKELGINGKAGRWGGEEFMICISGSDALKAPELAEEFRVRFNNIRFKDAGFQTISAGTALANEDDNTESLCIRVDTALYTAKKNGKNMVVTM